MLVIRQMKWIRHFFLGLRHCAICHASFPKSDWICEGCYKDVKSQYLDPKDLIRIQHHLSHVRLLDWNKANDFLIRKLLNSFKKGGIDQKIYQEMAEELFHRFLAIRCLNRKTLFVSAPSSVEEKKEPALDHASLFAKSLSEVSGFPFKNILSHIPGYYKKSAGQRKKTKLERQGIKLILKNKDGLDQFENIIFIDDVLTTGATAYAAFKVLKHYGKFMIMTIAWRNFIPPEEQAVQGEKLF